MSALTRAGVLPICCLRIMYVPDNEYLICLSQIPCLEHFDVPDDVHASFVSQMPATGGGIESVLGS